MSRVIVGVDPHKKSVTIEAVDEHGRVLSTGRFSTDNASYRAMVSYVQDQWPHHRWAVEGANGVGRPLAQRLLAQGETVLDVPAKLAARVRVFDTGNARKTDATDAHAVAMVALRTPRLTQLAYDEELIALRVLTDRREELSKLRVQTVNRLHRLLTELIPGGANKRDLSQLQAKRLLATVKPRSLVGKTIRRMAAEEIADLVAVDAKLKAIKKELRVAVNARGSHLMDLFGVGPAGAARIYLWPPSPLNSDGVPDCPAEETWFSAALLMAIARPTEDLDLFASTPTTSVSTWRSTRPEPGADHDRARTWRHWNSPGGSGSPRSAEPRPATSPTSTSLAKRFGTDA